MLRHREINARLANIRKVSVTEVYVEIINTLRDVDLTDYTSLFTDNFPLLNAVARGGKERPRVLAINASKLTSAPSILIGKGLTFDSGGIQSKGDHMDGMFFDKLGACLVVSYCIMNREVPGIIFLTNNLVSETSYIPGEIIPAYNGKKVLISHTDAEGRLGLADCIAYAEKMNKKAEKISIATLTGAASSFTSDNTYALLHSYRDDIKIRAIERSQGSLSGKDDIGLWPAPRHKSYKSALKTKVKGADIQSCASGLNGGGSMSAYEFLATFSKKLTHLDIAAMGVKDDQATGWGLEEVQFVLDNLGVK